MFTKSSDGGYTEVLEGVKLKTLAHGGRTLLSTFRISKRAEIPTHHHPHEQTGYLVSGRLDFVIGDERLDARPGDSWNIAGDVPHGATALEDSVVIEVFSPVREEYLQYGPEDS
ncbi:MAG: cupin domain-containing protein [Gemmatimonadota bacterium]|nr:MAG: cupin domain-containing protein [Gemmatimonadota bacterium]